MTLAVTALRWFKSEFGRALAVSARLVGAEDGNASLMVAGHVRSPAPHPRCSYNNRARIVPSSARISASTRWLSAAEASASKTT